MRLIISGLVKFSLGFIIVSALLFIPAGTVEYYNGWLFLGLLFIPILILGIVLYIKSPDLLAKRLNGREEQTTQKGVVAVSGLLFFVGFIIAGLDYRYGWSEVPVWAVIVASLVLLISYALYVEVMRENAYLSRTVEVTEGQSVVDTGLYGIVRHPMYSVTIWLFLSIPIVLGSLWAFLCFLPYIPVIIVRINNEEKVLRDALNGYDDYMMRVKYRLIPFIW